MTRTFLPTFKPDEASKLKSRKIEKRTKPSWRVASPILPEIAFFNDDNTALLNNEMKVSTTY